MASKQSVREELEKALKITQRDGEDIQKYIERVCWDANDPKKISEDEWTKFTDATQTWVNTNLRIIERNKSKDASERVELNPFPTDEVEVKSSKSEEKDKDKKSGSEAKGDAAAEKGEGDAKPDKASKDAKNEEKSDMGKANGANKGRGSKKAAAAKSTGPKKEGSGARGRPGKFASDATIKFLVKENPHRPGTGRFKRWTKYKAGMTVAEALKAGLNYGNLHHSVKDKHISIVPKK